MALNNFIKVISFLENIEV